MFNVGMKACVFSDFSDISAGKRSKTGTSTPGHLEAQDRYTLGSSEKCMAAAATSTVPDTV